jgi:probable F420-dependent oxidoreductase
MKIDLSIMGTALENVPAAAKRFEESGVDGLFSAEGPHDVFAPLYLAAAGSPDLGLMTNAAIGFPRNPIHLAHSAFDLQRLTKGNFRLGVAPQVSAHIERRFGIEWSKPVARMADLIDALHAIFDAWQNGTELNHVGPYYSHTLMTPMFNPGSLEWGAPPVLLGALGPVMTRLAAEKADGLTILPFCSEALLRASTFPAIVEGLAGAVRSRDDLEIVCGAIVGLGDTDEELEVAKERVKALLGFYGSTAAYRRVLASVDREEVGPLLAARVRAGDFASLFELIDDELVELLAVVGRPSDVAVRLTERFGWLADRLALFFPSEPSGASLSSLTDALIV